MKLLSLYIENYGKLSQVEYFFNKDLTVFCQENGYGKSTIASFIKAMFYGLPKVISARFNERVHYYPFSGGKFGGNLTFESQGDEYKIVRFFDKKSETKDEVKLYKNNEEVKNFSDNLGKYFFGLNENSFAKTVFLGDELNKEEDFSDITLKLTGLTSIGGDDEYKKAVDALDVEKKKYRQARGNNDVISRLKSEINELKEQIKGLETISKNIGDKYEQKKTLKGEYLEKSNQLKRLTKIKADAENYMTYQGYLKEISDAKTELENIKNRYPNGVITDEDLTSLNDFQTELINLEYSKNLITFDSEKDSKCASYSSLFKDGNLTENDFVNIKKDVDFISDNSTAKPKDKNSDFIVLGLGLMVPAISLCFITILLPLAIVFIAIGVLCLGVGTYLVASHNKNLKNYDNIAKNCLQKKEKLQLFFNKYNVDSNDLLSGYYQLKSKQEDYLRLLEEKQNYLQKIGDINEKIIDIKRRISGIFSKYKIVENSSIKEQILSVEKDAIYYKEIYKKYQNSVDRANLFKEQRKVVDTQLEDVNDYDKISLELDNLNKKISLIDNEIKEDENLLEYLPEKQARLQELEDDLEKAIRKHSDLSLALDFLVGAEKSLKDKYVAPLKDTFIYYSQKLEKALGEKVVVSSDFKIYFEKGGEIRSSEHLSQGQKVLVDFLIRLALIDNMYKQERPFIVLDDPFSTLDDEHIKKAKILVDELSKDRQIIYFTCHSSRNL